MSKQRRLRVRAPLEAEPMFKGVQVSEFDSSKSCLSKSKYPSAGRQNGLCPYFSNLLLHQVGTFGI